MSYQLSLEMKQILSVWVKENPSWTTIDDLPNEIFIPLVNPAGSNTDERVKIQIQAIEFMKNVPNDHTEWNIVFERLKA